MIEISESQRQDPTFHRTHGAEVGRDGCRIPLPWQSTASNLGFGKGKPPHLPQPQWMSQYAVDLEESDEASTLSMYRQAIHIRQEQNAAEELEWGSLTTESVLHFSRPNGWEIVLNCGNRSVPLPSGREMINSTMTPLRDRQLPAYTAVWLHA